ncbi:DUF87 domain-containing protein [Tardisphaera miroshnichenkoae]
MIEYEIRPLPYYLLDDDDRKKAEDAFVSMARQLESLAVRVTRDEDGSPRFALAAEGKDAEAIMDSLGVEHSKIVSIDQARRKKKEGEKEKEGKSGQLKRFLDRMPRVVRTGLIAEAINFGMQVEMTVRLEEDLGWLERRYRVLRAMGSAKREYEDVSYMLENADSEGVFDVVVALSGDEKRMKAWARSNGIRLARRQSTVVMAGSSLATLFPFSSYEVAERGGIRLGQNSITGSQVVYDFFSRRNYNVPVIGPSGTGKSALLKIIAHRLSPMLSTLPGSQLIVLDPEGEYKALAGAIDAQEVDLGNAGLDPVSSLPPGDACELLSSTLELERSEKHLLQRTAMGCRSTKDLLEALKGLGSSEAKQLSLAISSLLEGPFSSAFERPPPSIPDRVIMSFPSEQRRKEFLAPLALPLIWEEVKRRPADVPKLLIIDEGWLFLNRTPSAMENVIRLGRKINLLVFFASQRPVDFTSTSAGRTLMENSSTKILLKQDDDAMPELSSLLKLGERERQFLRSIPSPRSRGYSQALVVDEWRRLPVNVVPDREELNLI